MSNQKQVNLGQLTCGSPKYELGWDSERNMSLSCFSACEARSNCKRVLWKKRAFYPKRRRPECAAHQLKCCSLTRPPVSCSHFSHNASKVWVRLGYPLCASSVCHLQSGLICIYAPGHRILGLLVIIRQPISQNEFFHLKTHDRPQPTSRPEPVWHWCITATITRPRLLRGILLKQENTFPPHAPIVSDRAASVGL